MNNVTDIWDYNGYEPDTRKVELIRDTVNGKDKARDGPYGPKTMKAITDAFRKVHTFRPELRSDRKESAGKRCEDIFEGGDVRGRRPET